MVVCFPLPELSGRRDEQPHQDFKLSAGKIPVEEVCLCLPCCLNTPAGTRAALCQTQHADSVEEEERKKEVARNPFSSSPLHIEGTVLHTGKRYKGLGWEGGTEEALGAIWKLPASRSHWHSVRRGPKPKRNDKEGAFVRSVR